MWTTIVNPKTGRKVSVNGILGKSILKKYIKQVGGRYGPCAINPKSGRCSKSKVSDGKCKVKRKRCVKIKNPVKQISPARKNALQKELVEETLEILVGAGFRFRKNAIRSKLLPPANKVLFKKKAAWGVVVWGLLFHGDSEEWKKLLVKNYNAMIHDHLSPEYSPFPYKALNQLRIKISSMAGI